MNVSKLTTLAFAATLFFSTPFLSSEERSTQAAKRAVISTVGLGLIGFSAGLLCEANSPLPLQRDIAAYTALILGARICGKSACAERPYTLEGELHIDALNNWSAICDVTGLGLSAALVFSLLKNAGFFKLVPQTNAWTSAQVSMDFRK